MTTLHEKAKYIIYDNGDVKKWNSFNLFEDAVKEFTEGDSFCKYIPAIDSYIDITNEMTHFLPLGDSD